MEGDYTQRYNEILLALYENDKLVYNANIFFQKETIYRHKKFNRFNERALTWRITYMFTRLLSGQI